MMLAMRDLVDALDASETPYLVGGSLASAFHGCPRSTIDADIVIDVDRAGAANLKSALEPKFFVQGVEDAFSVREEYRSFQALHEEELFKVDIFICDEDEYSQAAFSRKIRGKLGGLIDTWLAASEDIVLRKILWHNLGRRMRSPMERRSSGNRD